MSTIGFCMPSARRTGVSAVKLFPQALAASSAALTARSPRLAALAASTPRSAASPPRRAVLAPPVPTVRARLPTTWVPTSPTLVVVSQVDLRLSLLRKQAAFRCGS